MRLRQQLAAVSILTLALPWAGARYVREMEGALRGGFEQSLSASAATMAAALDENPALVPRTDVSADVDATLYAWPLDRAPRLDGYIDDWGLDEHFSRSFGDGHRYWAGVYERYLYLLLEIHDPTRVYPSSPTATPYGDRVLLHLDDAAEPWLLVHTAAPGRVRAMLTEPPAFAPRDTYEDRVFGAWTETADGFSLELRLPLSLVGDHLGVTFIDVDPEGEGFAARLEGPWKPDDGPPPRLLYRPRPLAELVGRFAAPGRRLRVVDAGGWVLYDAGSIDAPDDIDSGEAGSAPPTSLTGRLYRLVLGNADPVYRELESPPGLLGDRELRRALGGERVARWFQRGAAMSAVVAAAVPIRNGSGIGGAVVLEQGSDAILTLTNVAVARLVNISVLASLVAAIGLLGYATLLSVRIRRLATGAQGALAPSGEISSALPSQRAGDEIGDLARSFASLLRRLGGYTDYLRTLKGKLAHELRTPLAVLSTSLDNLEREPHDAAIEPYVARLREGVVRLDRLVESMSEATALERAIEAAEHEVFDPEPVVSGCVRGYREIYADHRFELELEGPYPKLRGSPELLQQMLDKLVANAASFSPAGSRIDIALVATANEVRLSVTNPGSRLPRGLDTQLFEALVSVRQGADDGKHLGLGLYIAALIVRHHGGHIRAANLPDDVGVVVSASFPAAAA